MSVLPEEVFPVPDWWRTRVDRVRRNPGDLKCTLDSSTHPSNSVEIDVPEGNVIRRCDLERLVDTFFWMSPSPLLHVNHSTVLQDDAHRLVITVSSGVEANVSSWDESRVLGKVRTLFEEHFGDQVIVANSGEDTVDAGVPVEGAGTTKRVLADLLDGLVGESSWNHLYFRNIVRVLQTRDPNLAPVAALEARSKWAVGVEGVPDSELTSAAGGHHRAEGFPRILSLKSLCLIENNEQVVSVVSLDGIGSIGRESEHPVITDPRLRVFRFELDPERVDRVLRELPDLLP